MNASARQRRAARLEYVLEYIDAHPGDTSDVEFLSALASISPFHFHRVMSSYLGESVSAYVRRRTLERAALRMLLDGASVTASSVMSGYSSSSAFARAFRRQFGHSPRDLAQRLNARRTHCASYMPADLQYRTLPAQDLLALRRYGAQHSAAPAAWAAVRELLRDNAGGAPRTLIGIPCDSPELTPSERRRYDACVDITLPPHGELVRKRLAAGDYAVFQFRGTLAALEQAHGAVRWHWYPQSGTRMRDVPAFHRLGELRDDGELTAEIFFPVENVAARARLFGASSKAGDGLPISNCGMAVQTPAP
ncbi:MAG: AraC family transcriptional regulator [Gammaproteobacteria bacterium]|nr:AraC family transcriptional regulator [Gammaproteobacteria bacterium]